ncbi:MAG: amino acid adenylation domain-containing protein [Candidatus Omnitrophota bacterium]
MSMLDLFSRLKASGINLTIVDNNLKINAPKGALTAVLLSELKEKKEEIIQFLQRHVQKQDEYSSIPRANKKNYYALSSAQKRLYILYRMDKNVTVYNIPGILLLKGELDKKKLEETFKRLLDRHESLRTTFDMKDDVPVQQIHDTIDFRVDYHELMNRTPEEVEQFTRDFIRPFDLTKGPLFRVGLVKINDDEHLWIVDMHHIISDGFSLGILIKEFMAFYAGETLPELHIQYKDFAEWQQSEKQRLAIKQQEEFWLKTFAGEIPLLDLPTDFERPEMQSFKGDAVMFTIENPQAAALKQLAMNVESTLFMVLVAICNILLSRLSGQDDIVIGTPTAGRRHSDLEALIGMFVNTIPLRNYPQADKTVSQLLREVKVNTLSAFDNEGYQFEELVEKLEIPRDTSRNPLFVVVFALQNLDIPDIEIPGLKLTPYRNTEDSAKFDLHFGANEGSDGLTVNIQYCTALFKEETVQRFARYFKQIAKRIIDNVNIKIEDIDIIPEEERAALIDDFNHTDTPYPRNMTLNELFEEHVAKNPGQVSLILSEDGKDDNHRLSITYKDLKHRTDRLADELKEKGVVPGSIVGLKVQRSMEAVTAVLAIMKAGGAFLPIDPDYPQDRVDYMLKDSGAVLLVTTNPEENGFSLDPLNLSSSQPLNLLQPATGYRPPAASVAYIIYTSGSTGQPKGVMIRHSNVINYISWAIRQYVREEVDRFPLFTSLSFDLTITSIFTPLLSGNAIVVYGGSNKESLIEKVITDNQVDIVKLTPSHLRLLVNAWKDKTPKKEKIDSRIKRFIVGGEALETSLAREMTHIMKNPPEIYNEYGPTETTVGCMIYRYDPDNDQRPSVPVGIPSANARIYLLDKNHQPVPIGVPGEMYISGAGVSSGYLNRPALTRERFISNPFIPGERMYKTGDLARFIDKGNIEYIGRVDQQVKIRGFRIELGEIENKLRSYRKHPPINVSFHDDIFEESNHIARCRTCLLPANYPNIQLDEDGVCHTCREYQAYKTEVDRYFKTDADFDRLIEGVKNAERGKYDCLLLFSGGKDSTYVLYRLIDMGLKVLTFTFDNGYISDAAFANIKKTTAALGVDSLICKAENMNRIFVESLYFNHNVCHGCWNALNTLGVKVAHEKGINLVISGLSRGQIFEMRLEGLFERGIFSEKEIEENLLIFRKTFHSKSNRFGRLLDMELAEDLVEQIQFVDFFRYFNVSVKEIREYLNQKGWVQPVDTGFCSSNCIINDVGIYVFQKERGYHFYAAPLSWDCRLGVISREQGLRETTFEGDLESVDRILKEIGYYQSPVKDVIVIDNQNAEGEKFLSAYIVSDEPLTITELRDYLVSQLPDYMVPSQFIQIDHIPLTPNGKLDRKALGRSGKQLQSERAYVAPENETEEKLAALWADILDVEKVGVESNFFELGGNSLSLIKMNSKLNQVFDKDIPVGSLFRLTTIRALAKYLQDEEINLQVNEAVLDQSLNTFDETLSLLGGE